MPSADAAVEARIKSEELADWREKEIENHTFSSSRMPIADIMSKINMNKETLPFSSSIRWYAYSFRWSRLSMHKLLIEIPSELETERLLVRKYTRGDGKKLYALFERNNNRELLKEHVDEAENIKTEEDAEIDVREHAAEWESRKRFVLGVWLKSSGEYVGQIWIEPKKWEVPSFELGYYIDQGFIGKGLATEAAIRSLKFLFEDLKAHKVTIITRDTNERSWRMAERLGFVKEGHSRECSIEEGKRWGLLYYGMLNSEFKSA